MAAPIALPARRLVIDGKCRPHPVAVADPTHFRHHDGGVADARIVLTSPNISLYCLDPARREAIFVEVSSDVDLAAAPFYYQVQYESATGLIAVGFEVLHELADSVPDPGRLLLLYSVGRCGSTVISRMLRETPGVLALSEPDVFTQLTMLREAGELTDDEVAALVRTCTRIVCAPAAEQVVAIKFRSFAVDLATIFADHFPTSRAVFLYRDAIGWATSTMRAFGPSQTASVASQIASQDRHALLLPLLAQYRQAQGRLLTQHEMMACHWVALMRGALSWQATGAELFALRYRDLVTSPQAALAALYTYMKVPPPADSVLEAVLAADSQAGTALARDALDHKPQGEIDVAALIGIIAELESGRGPTRLSTDTILPGTWAPNFPVPSLPPGISLSS
jgi:hypothetical protein